MRLKNYIGGEWVDARSGQVAEALDPADRRKPIAEYALSGAEDAAAAVAAAKAALPAWRAMPAPRRGRVLSRAAHEILRNLDELARVLTVDEGKTLEESRSELRRAAEAFEFCAGETRRLAGETLPSEVPNRLVFTTREPIGVVGLITPWNYPAQIAAWKIGPALAMGNTVVFKPSSQTPLISQKIVEVVIEALAHEGAPSGAINLVSGSGSVVGPAISTNADVAAISFTGSIATGSDVMRSLAERGAPSLCEMGGKNPLVVLDDADVEFAALACVRGAFGNAGQRCTATSRVIVLPGIAQKFTDALVARTAKLRVGSGLDASTDVGPLVSDSIRDGVESAVSRALEHGAKALCGGGRPKDAGTSNGVFYLPTVLTGVAPDAHIAQEEVFGPVVVLLPAKDDADALALANGVRFGLSASVYTRDLDRAFYFARGFEAGIVHVNSPTVGGETHVPFGGMKDTSNGGRERGRASVDFYTRWKTVYIDSKP